MPKNNFLIQSTLAKCYQLLGSEDEMLNALRNAQLGKIKKMTGKRNIEAVHLFINLAMAINADSVDNAVDVSESNAAYAGSVHHLLYKLGWKSSD